MSYHRLATAACVAAFAAITIPTTFASAAPSGGAKKVSAKGVVSAKSPGFKVSGAAKSSVPSAKAAKSVKRSP